MAASKQWLMVHVTQDWSFSSWLRTTDRAAKVAKVARAVKAAKVVKVNAKDSAPAVAGKSARSVNLSLLKTLLISIVSPKWSRVVAGSRSALW
jgi:hypothetical protein